MHDTAMSGFAANMVDLRPPATANLPVGTVLYRLDGPRPENGHFFTLHPKSCALQTAADTSCKWTATLTEQLTVAVFVKASVLLSGFSDPLPDALHSNKMNGDLGLVKELLGKLADMKISGYISSHEGKCVSLDTHEVVLPSDVVERALEFKKDEAAFETNPAIAELIPQMGVEKKEELAEFRRFSECVESTSDDSEDEEPAAVAFMRQYGWLYPLFRQP